MLSYIHYLNANLRAGILVSSKGLELIIPSVFCLKLRTPLRSWDPYIFVHNPWGSPPSASSCLGIAFDCGYQESLYLIIVLVNFVFEFLQHNATCPSLSGKTVVGGYNTWDQSNWDHYILLVLSQNVMVAVSCT